MIPKPVRDLLGVVPGSAVCLELAPDIRVIVIKADDQPRPRGRFARLRGTADAGMSKEQIIALTRGRDECAAQ